MEKTGVSTSGVFTIKEYLMDESTGIPELIRKLQAGPEKIQEVISYVFEGEDPLQIDTKSFGAEDFLKLYPQMKSYGPGLAFDIVIRTGGQPVTVELTQGERTVCTNSLDEEIELEDLLGTSADEPVKDETDPAEAGRESAQEQGMTPQGLSDIIRAAERLRCGACRRDTSGSGGRRGSAAEHSWSMALLAMLLSGFEEYRGYDMDRVIRMCLIRDPGEALTDDIPTSAKAAEDKTKEIPGTGERFRGFPAAQRKAFETLYAEMQELETPEAKLCEAIDKIESVLQYNESDIGTRLTPEHDLQMIHEQIIHGQKGV